MKTSRCLLVLAVSILWATSAAATGELGGPAAAESGATESAAETSDKVARAILTSNIVDREPVDDLESLTNDHTRIYFFTELQDLEGTRVTHKWEYQGKIMSEVHLTIGGSHWRIWSSKNLDPTWLGHWTVSVVSEDGMILASDTFIYAEE
jgi:hypothetical protein